MRHRQSPTHPYNLIPRARDQRNGDGFRFRWLRYDERPFTDILQQWQDKTAPRDRDAFIRHQLRLDGAISEYDLRRLLSGEAIPSPALTRWLSAVLPADIATPRLFRNRGLGAAARLAASDVDPQCLVDIDRGAIAKARLARLKEIAEFHHRDDSPSASAFLEELMEHLCERAGRDDLDQETTVAHLATYLGIAPNVLRGRAALPEDHAKHVGEELAVMFELRGDEFDVFANHAASELSHCSSLPPDTALTRLAAAARFLREQAGLTQADLGRRLGQASKSAVRAWERGSPVFTATKVARALNLDDRETAVLAQLTTKAMQELTHPTPGRKPTHLEEVVEHFAAYGLTTSDYLKAALNRPQLFYQLPATIAGNIEAAVAHFDLKTSDYLKAVLKRPELFSLSPARIAYNVESVVAHFAADGLTKNDYLKAAVKRPQLFCQSPAVITSNIESIVERFAADGLTKRDYLKAVLKQPALFSQSPATIGNNIALVIDLHDRGVFYPPTASARGSERRPTTNGHAAVLAFLMRNPNLMCLGIENYAVREIHQEMTDAPRNSMLLCRTRHAVERELMKHLGHDDPSRPVPNGGFVAARQKMSEENAKRFVLRALMHGKLIRDGSLEH